jgi:hypothetical protein
MLCAPTMAAAVRRSAASGDSGNAAAHHDPFLRAISCCPKSRANVIKLNQRVP